MADFTARIVSTHVVKDWVDDRLNPTLGIPHRYIAVQLGTTIEIKCTPNETGVEGDVDANLGGRLFAWWFAEWSSGSPPAILTVAANTADASFTPVVVGHYLVQVGRPSGGGVAIHFDVEDPP